MRNRKDKQADPNSPCADDSPLEEAGLWPAASILNSGFRGFTFGLPNPRARNPGAFSGPKAMYSLQDLDLALGFTDGMEREWPIEQPKATSL